MIETIINKSEKVKELKQKAKDKDRTAKQAKELTDFRENTLQNGITKLEPDLFRPVTGLGVQDCHLLAQLKVFNTEQMNAAVFAFRTYEDASLPHTGISGREGLSTRGSRGARYVLVRSEDHQFAVRVRKYRWSDPRNGAASHAFRLS